MTSSITISTFATSIGDNSITISYFGNNNDSNGRVDFFRNGVFAGDSTLSSGTFSSTFTYSGLSQNTTYQLYANLVNSIVTVTSETLTPTTTCYLSDTLILLSTNEYKKIQDLDTSDIVKTTEGNIKIRAIQKIFNNMKNRNELQKIHKLSKKYDENLIEDLYITGGHSILVDKLTLENEIGMKKYFGDKLPQIDGKYLLLACVDPRFEPVEFDEEITLYHILLENEDKDKQYAIYANGILSESISKTFYLKNGYIE